VNNDDNDNNIEASPRWWYVFRRVVIFLLGVAVIVDALVDKDPQAGELVIGVIMIGVLPLDDLAQLIPRRPTLRRDRSSV
jgi:hypothetical protein